MASSQIVTSRIFRLPGFLTEKVNEPKITWGDARNQNIFLTFFLQARIRAASPLSVEQVILPKENI
jgi:hypothetical protein